VTFSGTVSAGGAAREIQVFMRGAAFPRASEAVQ
jgi:hypothetical protein